MMKRIFTTIIIAGALCFPQTSIASDTTGKPPPKFPIPTDRKKENDKKRDSSEPTPSCYYSDGCINVVSDSWSFATVYVCNEQTGTTVANSGYLDEGIDIYISPLSGSYTITIVTESNAEFYGYFSL